MGIEALGRLDLVAREGDGYPSARVFGAPCLEPQAVHAHSHALGREACAHIQTDERSDSFLHILYVFKFHATKVESIFCCAIKLVYPLFVHSYHDITNLV